MPILDGHTQPGPGLKRCYGCGGLGRIRGDPKCPAGGTAIWKGAPDGFKKRMEGGTKKAAPQRKGGKGKGGSTQRNLGKRKAEVDTSRLPCHNWTRGNGFCKYAENCRYSHSGPQAGDGKSTALAATVKREKKAKVKKSSLVVTRKGESKA
jgi:hypothetical protein